MTQLAYSEIVAAVTDKCKMSNETTRIALAVTRAVRHLSGMFNFPQLEAVINNVTASESTISTAFPTLFKGFYDEDSVTIYASGKQKHLNIVLPGEYFSDHPNPTDDSEGEPDEVTIFENKFWWYPVPDDDYTIQMRIYKFHGTFDANNPHVFGEQFDFALIDLATGFVYEATQEYDDANYWIGKGEKRARKEWRNTENMLGIATVRSKPLYGASVKVTSDQTDYGRIVR